MGMTTCFRTHSNGSISFSKVVRSIVMLACQMDRSAFGWQGKGNDPVWSVPRNGSPALPMGRFCVVPSRRVSWGRNVQAAESRRAASLWGGASAGCTGGLDGKVLQLWKEVNRHGMLIISRLVDAMEGSVEEVGNWEQGKE